MSLKDLSGPECLGVLIPVLASFSLTKYLLTASPALIFVAFVMINACERCDV